MAFNFTKKIVVGVSVSPEKGLEVAQLDFEQKVVLKYGSRPLTYDNNRKEIADLDIFKETLSDLLFELQIPKGSDVVLNLPAIVFKINDYPASLTEDQVQSAIEEDLTEHPLFRDTDCSVSASLLPNSTMQFNKVAFTALQKTMLIEIAMQIKDLGYNLKAIDTSVGSTLNALIYNQRVEAASGEPWLLLTVDNSYCRILSMLGNSYIDSLEEKISIGEVLGDAENYATVSEAVNTLLKNIPAQRLYVISKTDVISAKILAEKLDYNGQIIHQDVNCFATEEFLPVSETVDANDAKNISLDVIGAATYRDLGSRVSTKFNLFNSSLGDVYLLEQPLVLKYNSLSLVLSIENAIVIGLVLAALAAIIVFGVLFKYNSDIEAQRVKINMYENDIKKYKEFLAKNEDVSTDIFNEAEEVQIGLNTNKGVYSYYSIVGTEIPQKLWLTYLELGKNITIEGQADNVESIYSFIRNVKDYNPEAGLKLQTLDLATKSNVSNLTLEEGFDTETIMSSMNADFYTFRLSNGPAPAKKVKVTKEKNKNKTNSIIDGLEPLE